MKVPSLSEAEAQKAARRSLIAAGERDAEIRKASDHRSAKDNESIALVVALRDDEGFEREIRDYLTGHALGQLKLRSLCSAMGPEVLAKYEAEGEISAADFRGPVRVKIDVERKKGWPPRNVIVSYAAPVARVVNLREAAG